MSNISFEKIHFQIPHESMDYIDKNVDAKVETLDDIKICLKAIRSSLLYKYPSDKSDFYNKRTNCLGATAIFSRLIQESFDTRTALVSNLPWQHPDRKIGLHTVNIVQVGQRAYLADPTPIAGYMHGQLEEVSRIDEGRYIYEDKILDKTCNLRILSDDEQEAIQDCMVIRTNFFQTDEQARNSLCALLPRLQLVPSYFAVASGLIDKASDSHDFINRTPIEAVAISKIDHIANTGNIKILEKFQQEEDKNKQTITDCVRDRLNVETDIYKINYLSSILQSMDFKRPSIDYEKFTDHPFPIRHYERYMIKNHIGRCASNLYSKEDPIA